jgi:prepilin-type N-terminal cleavage/methylation domain-containing protein
MSNRLAGRRNQGGFTLIELVMGMLICGFILLAAGTLSFALGRGQEVTDLMMGHQAMLRFVSVRIPELIHNSLAVWMTSDGDLAIWKGDANGNRRIEAGELAYLIINTAGKRIDLLTCQGLDTPVTASEVIQGGAKSAILASSSKVLVPLVKDSSQMEFSEQGRRYVIVRFSLPAESGRRDYQICARVRADISDWMDSL